MSLIKVSFLDLLNSWLLFLCLFSRVDTLLRECESLAIGTTALRLSRLQSFLATLCRRPWSYIMRCKAIITILLQASSATSDRPPSLEGSVLSATKKTLCYTSRCLPTQIQTPPSSPFACYPDVCYTLPIRATGRLSYA